MNMTMRLLAILVISVGIIVVFDIVVLGLGIGLKAIKDVLPEWFNLYTISAAWIAIGLIMVGVDHVRRKKPIKFDEGYFGKSATAILPEVKHFVNYHWKTIKLQGYNPLGKPQLNNEGKYEAVVRQAGIFGSCRTEIIFDKHEIYKINVFEQYETHRGHKFVEITIMDDYHKIRIEKNNGKEELQVIAVKPKS